MKIKFISNGLNQDGSLTGSRHRAVTVNMAYYFLKHYYYLHGLGDPTWLDGDLVHVQNFQDQFNSIKAQQPDMLALSVFVWNERTQFLCRHEGSMLCIRRLYGRGWQFLHLGTGLWRDCASNNLPAAYATACFSVESSSRKWRRKDRRRGCVIKTLHRSVWSH